MTANFDIEPLLMDVERAVRAQYRAFVEASAKALRDQEHDSADSFYDALDRVIINARPWYSTALGAVLTLGVSANRDQFAKEIKVLEEETAVQMLLTMAYYALRSDILEAFEQIGGELPLDFLFDLA